jgi:hypothetical protein
MLGFTEIDVRQISKTIIYNRVSRKFYDLFDNLMGTHIFPDLHNWSIDFHNNQYNFDSELIGIVHIPKTGGTSLKYILEKSNYSANFINLGKQSPISTKCPPERFKYVIFLRNPINRCFSYFQMCQRNSNIPWHKYSKDMPDFFKNCWEVRNMACSYISGSMKEVDSSSFAKAVENLNKMYFIGLFEDFEASVQVFLDKINLYNYNNAAPLCQTEIKVPHLNKYDYKGNDIMPEPTYHLIAEYNKYDILLYNYFIKEYFPEKSNFLIKNN